MRHILKMTLLTTVLAAVPAVSAVAGTITWWAPEFGKARAAELVERFKTVRPDITVSMEPVVANGLQNRILVALQSGNTPDLMDVANGWNIPFAATGKLLALDDVVKQQKIDLGDFLPAAVETATLDGKLYGLPFRAEAHALIYNKGAFKAAGLDPDKPPQTWDELLADARKLTGTNAKGEAQYGFGIAGGGEVSNTIFRSLPFLWMNGGNIISDDMKSVELDAPASVAAVDFYTGMLTREKVAPPSTLENDGTALRRLFIAGTIAMYQSGQFDLPSIRAENPNIEVGATPIPHPDGKPTAAILGGWNFAIPAAAKNPTDAAAFLAFLAAPENMGYYTDTFPARVSAMDLPRFQDPDLKAFKDMLPFARRQPPARNWVQITQTYFNHIQETLLGTASTAESMKAAAEDIEPLLDQ